MSNDRLFWFQRENIDKMVYRLMQIDFSNLLEVKELKRKIIEETTANLDFHVSIHNDLRDFHDCAEYESRNHFGNKLVRILDETIRELENEE